MDIKEYLHSEPVEALIDKIFVNVCAQSQAAWHGFAEIRIFTRNYSSTEIITFIGTRENPLFEHSEKNLKRAALKQYRLKNLLLRS